MAVMAVVVRVAVVIVVMGVTVVMMMSAGLASVRTVRRGAVGENREQAIDVGAKLREPG